MAMVTKDLRSQHNGCPTRPARRRSDSQVTQVAKALLRLSGDAAQWERAYDVLAWAHNQALAGRTHVGTGNQDYQPDALGAARSVREAEANLLTTELEGYLDLKLGQIADRLL